MSARRAASAERVEEWPDHDLIYVRDARRQHVQIGAQDGVQPHWLLDPEYDLILDWEPVDVADLLSRMQGKSRD